jgi:hypothetical protein
MRSSERVVYAACVIALLVIASLIYISPFAPTVKASNIVNTLPVPNGTSGGVPYYSSNTKISSSAALANGGVVLGGGSGAAPTTTGIAFFSNNIGAIGSWGTVGPTGVPAVSSEIDLTTQGSALTTQAFFTPVSGLDTRYRIEYTAKLTRAASASSILGGTTGFSIVYTDAQDSVSVTLTLPVFNQLGANIAVGTGVTTNTTQAVAHGEAVIWAKNNVAITYSYGYTSVGGTTMQYELHLSAEAF